MIKFRITPSRFAEACSILEYLAVMGGSRDTIINIAPRFILDQDGEYVVGVQYDADGDISGFENTKAALLAMASITPKRLEKLSDEFREAAKTIVDPPKGGGSNEPTSTAAEQPPPG